MLNIDYLFKEFTYTSLVHITQMEEVCECAVIGSISFYHKVVSKYFQILVLGAKRQS